MLDIINELVKKARDYKICVAIEYRNSCGEENVMIDIFHEHGQHVTRFFSLDDLIYTDSTRFDLLLKKMVNELRLSEEDLLLFNISNEWE